MDLSGADGSIRGRASKVEFAMKYRTLHEIVRQAQRNLDRECWDYLLGGADTESSLRRNRHGLDSWVFRPRILNDVSEVKLTTQLLGTTMRVPVVLPPIGSVQLFRHPADLELRVHPRFRGRGGCGAGAEDLPALPDGRSGLA
jgi:hypothetical protein